MSISYLQDGVLLRCKPVVRLQWESPRAKGEFAVKVRFSLGRTQLLGVAWPVCKFIYCAQLWTSARISFFFPACILTKGKACKVWSCLHALGLLNISRGIDSSKAAVSVALSFSLGLLWLIFASTNYVWNQRTASSEQLKISSVVCREGQRSLGDPGCRRSKWRSIDLMSGLALHKRRAVALSNRWLLVPIAGAAVSAAVGALGADAG